MVARGRQFCPNSCSTSLKSGNTKFSVGRLLTAFVRERQRHQIRASCQLRPDGFLRVLAPGFGTPERRQRFKAGGGGGIVDEASNASFD